MVLVTPTKLAVHIPGHLDHQLANISSGTKSIGRRALPMLNTPGDYEESGMAAIA